MTFLLAGSSCSGTSTAGRRCQDLGGLVVHDSDEDGVPRGANVHRGQENLESWVRRAPAYERAGRDLRLTGQPLRGEVPAVPSAARLERIGVCRLDVEGCERWARLERRGRGRWPVETKRAFNGWARWHRLTRPMHRTGRKW